MEEGSGTGIAKAYRRRDRNRTSRPRDPAARDRSRRDAIAEQFIDGRERYAVTVMGGLKLEVLPIRELVFGNMEPGVPKMATYKVTCGSKSANARASSTGSPATCRTAWSNTSATCASASTAPST